MPAEQLPTTVYLIGGQLEIDKLEIPESTKSFEEDGETIHKPDGTFGSEITYSRRKVLTARARILSKTTPIDEDDLLGGSITIDTKDYKIRNATISYERGIRMVELDLIALDDMIGE